VVTLKPQALSGYITVDPSLNIMKKLHNLVSHKDRVWHLDWSPDGQFLATCSADKSILIWRKDFEEFRVVDRLDGSHTKTVRKVKWSRSGEHLASGSFDGTVVVWRKGSDKIEGVLTLEGHENEVKGVSWSSEDRYLATCGRDKTIWVWETDVDYEYYTMAVLSKHNQDVKSVEFHSSQMKLISCSYDNTIVVWVLSGQDWLVSEILLGHEGTVWEARWIGINDIVSVSDDLTIKLWVEEQDDKKLHLNRTLSGAHSRSIYSVDWKGDWGVSV